MTEEVMVGRPEQQLVTEIMLIYVSTNNFHMF